MPTDSDHSIAPDAAPDITNKMFGGAGDRGGLGMFDGFDKDSEPLAEPLGKPSGAASSFPGGLGLLDGIDQADEDPGPAADGASAAGPVVDAVHPAGEVRHEHSGGPAEAPPASPPVQEPGRALTWNDLTAALLVAPVALPGASLQRWRVSRARAAAEKLERAGTDFGERVRALLETPLGSRLQEHAEARSRNDASGAARAEDEIQWMMNHAPAISREIAGIERDAHRILSAAGHTARLGERAQQRPVTECAQQVVSGLGQDAEPLEGIRLANGEDLGRRIAEQARRIVASIQRILSRLGLPPRDAGYGPPAEPEPRPT